LFITAANTRDFEYHIGANCRRYRAGKPLSAQGHARNGVADTFQVSSCPIGLADQKSGLSACGIGWRF
jgi:hypothetical protein